MHCEIDFPFKETLEKHFETFCGNRLTQCFVAVEKIVELHYEIFDVEIEIQFFDVVIRFAPSGLLSVVQFDVSSKIGCENKRKIVKNLFVFLI